MISNPRLYRTIFIMRHAQEKNSGNTTNSLVVVVIATRTVSTVSRAATIGSATTIGSVATTTATIGTFSAVATTIGAVAIAAAARAIATTAAVTTRTATRGTAATFRAVAGLVNADGASFKLGFVHVLQSAFGFVVVGEGDKAKATGTTGLAVLDNDGVFNLTEFLELGAKGLIVGVPRETSNE